MSDGRKASILAKPLGVPLPAPVKRQPEQMEKVAGWWQPRQVEEPEDALLAGLPPDESFRLSRALGLWKHLELAIHQVLNESDIPDNIRNQKIGSIAALKLAISMLGFDPEAGQPRLKMRVSGLNVPPKTKEST